MEFMNVWMLLGLLGISVPIVIHLLNRRSSRTIDWGAFRFLLNSMLKRRRKVLLEEMLLMACRCLVIALLALALSRPFIQPTSRVPWVVVMPMILVAIAAFGASFAMWRFPVWRRRLVLVSLAFSMKLLVILSKTVSKYFSISSILHTFFNSTIISSSVILFFFLKIFSNLSSNS